MEEGGLKAALDLLQSPRAPVGSPRPFSGEKEEKEEKPKEKKDFETVEPPEPEAPGFDDMSNEEVEKHVRTELKKRIARMLETGKTPELK